MSDRDPKHVIEGIERNLATWEEGEGYCGGYDFDAERSLVNDLRTLLEITKTALEPNTTIDFIHDPDGAIERLTVAANSVRIETYGDVRFTPISDPPPYGHGTVRVTIPFDNENAGKRRHRCRHGPALHMGVHQTEGSAMTPWEMLMAGNGEIIPIRVIDFDEDLIAEYLAPACCH